MWPDHVDEILDRDHAIAFATVTPAKGVIITPVTNFGIRDRDAGTLEAVNTSIGLWEKLRRVERDPHVAIAYHTRAHARTDRPEYVLVQGRARTTPQEDRGYLQRHRERWESSAGAYDTNPLWERWRRVYHWRVGIVIDVERVLVWPDLSCRGEPEVHGAPLPEDLPSQQPPKKGTGPRIDHAKAATRWRKLPDVLLGWTTADGFPMVVPVDVGAADDHGVHLEGPLPQGARRAGLTAHWFAPFMVGQEQRIHTGWLDGDVYAPHTKAGYRFPASLLLFRIVGGGAARVGLRRGRKAGYLNV